MQIIFLILTAITIGIMAEKRRKKPWGWGIFAGITFLVIDTVVALLLIFFRLKIYYMPDMVFLFAAVLQKLLVFGALVGIFHVSLRPVAVAPQTQTQEQPPSVESTQLDTQKLKDMQDDRIARQQQKELYQRGVCPQCKEKIDFKYTKCFACDFDFFENKLTEN